MEFCTKCGKSINKDDVYCRNCGLATTPQPRQHRTQAQRMSPNPKIVGYCDTCHSEWYSGDMKCRVCNGDDYTSIFSSESPDESADSSNLPIPRKLPWVIAFLPLLGLIVENAIAVLTEAPIQGVWWITFLLNTGLCWWDASKIKVWFPDLEPRWAFVVPVYLYKRAKRLKQNLAYFFVWIAMFLLITVVPSQTLLNLPLINQLGLGSSETIMSVKNAYLDGYSDKTVGQAFDAYLQDEKWTSFTATDGLIYVQVTGSKIDDNRRTRHLLIQFPFNRDNSRFIVGAWKIDEQPINAWEALTQLINVYQE